MSEWDGEDVDRMVEQAREDTLADLDLNDAATANAVADAIVRYRGGGHVMFSERYPWIRDAEIARRPEREVDLLRALLADPLQHEHVIDVRDDGAWTMRHPIAERIESALFDCRVADRVHDLGIDAMPDSGVYVVRPGEGHIDFLVAP